jgi:hypothetical protein
LIVVCGLSSAVRLVLQAEAIISSVDEAVIIVQLLTKNFIFMEASP